MDGLRASLGRELHAVRTSQPQGVVGIDWGNPLTRGLIAANIPGIGEMVSGKAAPLSTSNTIRSTKNGTAMGVRISSNSVAGNLYIPRRILSAKTDFVLVNWSNLYAYDSGCASSSDGISMDNNISRIRWGAHFTAWNTYGALAIVNTIVPLFTGVTTSIAGVWNKDANSGQGRVFVNNTPCTYVTGGLTTVSDRTHATATTGFGVSGHQNNRGTLLTLHWERDLSDAELASINDNPWQIFEPRRVLLPVTSLARVAPVTDRTLEIDYSNPITRGLLAAATTLMVPTPTTLDTRFGIASLSMVNVGPKLINYPATNGLTVLSLGMRNSNVNTTSNSIGALVRNSNQNNNDFGARIDAYTGQTGLNATVVYTDYTYSFVPQHTLPAQNKQLLNTVTVYKRNVSDGLRVWADGILVGSTATLDKNLFPVPVNLVFSNVSGGATLNRDNPGLLGALWDRALSDSEVESLNSNPWQLFRVKQEEIVPEAIKPKAIEKPSIPSGTLVPVPYRARTSQPQQPTGIAWGNPITRGLVSVLKPLQHFPFAVEVVGSTLGVTNPNSTFKPVPGVFGVELLNEGTRWTGITGPSFVSVLALGLTQVILVRALKNIAVASRLGGIGGTNQDNGNIALSINSSGNVTVFSQSYQDVSFGTLTSASLDGGLPKLVVVTTTETEMTLSVNGTNRVSANGQFPFGSVSSPRINYIRVGSEDLSSNTIAIGLSAVWNRVLSAAEIKSLSDNPWQIFEPNANLLPPSKDIQARAPITPRSAKMLGSGRGLGASAVAPVWVNPTRTSQPQTPTGIDWGNPITRGLTSCLIVRDGVLGFAELVKGNGLLDPNLKVTSTKFGKGITPTVLTARNMPGYFQKVDTFTRVFVATPQISGTGSISDSNFGATTGAQIQLSATGLSLNQSNIVNYLSTTIGGKEPICAAIVCGTARQAIFIEGTLRTARTGTVSFGAGGTGVLFSGNNNLERYDGTMLLHLDWNRALSDAEASAITANPWQIFQSPQPNVWTST